MKRRTALQASLTGMATALVPSLALGSAIEVPEGAHVVVDGTGDGEVTFVGDWCESDEDAVMAQIDQLLNDPDYHVIANFPIVCLDPELQSRVTVLLRAGEEEIEAERERRDQESMRCCLAEFNSVTGRHPCSTPGRRSPA